jgi:hypothetical protein
MERIGCACATKAVAMSNKQVVLGAKMNSTP